MCCRLPRETAPGMCCRALQEYKLEALLVWHAHRGAACVASAQGVGHAGRKLMSWRGRVDKGWLADVAGP